MRGKPCVARCCLSHHRNIPAYAGKTRFHPVAVREREEHPRVCGENRRKSEQQHRQIGTSPRMRGKLRPAGAMAQSLGNIPAYAGKTRWLLPGQHRRKEHPRVCGENPRVVRPPRLRWGTSPRMRGKLWRMIEDVEQFRNIPAYAGKT